MNVKGLQGYLLFAILGGFVAYMIWGQPKIDVDVESYELKIQLLEQRIDSIQTQNTELKVEADSLNTRISEYDIKINQLNSRIYVIKKQTEQKLDAVDNFGDDELERFFAERYRQYKDSIN
jgi:chromosome segregation ATPase